MKTFLKIISVVLFAIIGSCILGFIICPLWNWLMPTIFGLPDITPWQGIGLCLLFSFLFPGSKVDFD